MNAHPDTAHPRRPRHPPRTDRRCETGSTDQPRTTPRINPAARPRLFDGLIRLMTVRHHRSVIAGQATAYKPN